jgi:hypothetical protein
MSLADFLQPQVVDNLQHIGYLARAHPSHVPVRFVCNNTFEGQVATPHNDMDGRCGPWGVAVLLRWRVYP